MNHQTKFLCMISLFTSMHIYAGTCSYPLDATAAQISVMGPEYTKFPTVNLSEQKATVTLPQTLTPSNLQYVTTSATGANEIAKFIQQGGSSEISINDMSVVNNDILAIEYEFNINDLKAPLDNNEQIIVAFNILGSSKNGLMMTLIPKVAKTNWPSGGINQIASGEIMTAYKNNNGPEPIANYKYYNITIPTSGKVRIGTYINQSSRQVGYIINGVNYGYLDGNYVEPITSIHFMPYVAPSMGDNSQLKGKTISAKLITNKTQMIYSYPTGTTDICGNSI